MAGNFLQDILGQFSNVPDPSYMQPAPQSYSNVLTQAQPANYGGGGGSAPARQRPSVLDILGGLADSVAEMGGSTPGYQPTLDAATERRRQAEGDQMARQEFGLKQQRYGLDNRKAQFDMQQDQNKVLGVASGILSHALQTQGPEGASRIFGELGSRLGMTPEQLQQEQAHFNADPQAYLTAMSAFAKQGNGDAEYYGTQYYETDDKGNVYPYILGKDGTKQYITPGDGRRPAPKLSIENTGLGYQGISPYTGQPNGPTTPITAIPNQGVVVNQGPNGPEFAPIAGGEQDIKFSKDVTDLRTLGNALDSYESVFPDIRNNIDVMARSGSLSGVPQGATGVDGQPISGGSNIGAIVQQNVPYVEQLTNDQGFSARQQIESAGRTMVQQLGPLLTQAQNSGANLTSRMMDTPKELEGLLAQAINTKDYGAAVKAYDRFKARYDEVRREVQGRAKAAEAKTARGRQPPSGNAPAAPTVSNW